MRPGRRRKSSSRGRPVPKRPAETVVIEKIAQQGDGEAVLSDGTRVFIPLTLPGDKVLVQPGAKRGDGVSASVIDWLETSPRNEPICEVFGKCGGCQLQHLLPSEYDAWKTDAVRTTLSRHGLTPDINSMKKVPMDARRRATLGFVMTAAGPVLGFNEAYADRVVGMEGCPLLAPSLARLWMPLRDFCAGVFKAPARADVRITAADAGSVEVVVISDQKLDLAFREAIADFANTYDIARFCWQRGAETPEPVVQRSPVKLTIGKAVIELPMGGFLQPSVEGEGILQELVLDGVGASRHVADLYCGIGTFAFRLASEKKHVLAVDDNASQIAALDQAAGRAGLGGYMQTDVRDLRAAPLPPKKCEGMDAVVFDPPRAGARSQAEALAESLVSCVVAVSCNPATLARDLRILVDGGYEIESLTPVDQFPMSYHVEAVAVLKRSR